MSDIELEIKVEVHGTGMFIPPHIDRMRSMLKTVYRDMTEACERGDVHLLPRLQDIAETLRQAIAEAK